MDIILNSIGAIARKVLDLLPDSPFRYFIDQIGEIPFLGYLNYFVPVSDFVILLTAWTVAITSFYIISAVLRTINLID